MKKIWQDQIVGVICILIGITVLLLTRSFPKGAASQVSLTGPSFFPNILAIGLMLLGLYEILSRYFGAGEPGKEIEFVHFLNSFKKRQNLTILIVIGLMVFYIVFLKVIGFFTVSFIFLYLLLWRLGTLWWKNLITTAVFLGLIYIIFVEVFTIRLPSGLLF